MTMQLSRGLKEGITPSFFLPHAAARNRPEDESMTAKGLPIDAGTESLLRGRLEALGLELCHADWNPGPRPRHADALHRPARRRHAGRLRGRLARGVGGPRPARGESSRSTSSRSPLPASTGRSGRSRTARGSRAAASPCASQRKMDGAANLKGILEDVRGDSLTVLDEDQKRRYTVRFGDVRIARLVPEL